MKEQILDFETILNKTNLIKQSGHCEENYGVDCYNCVDCYDCDFNCEECDSGRD